MNYTFRIYKASVDIIFSVLAWASPLNRLPQHVYLWLLPGSTSRYGACDYSYHLSYKRYFPLYSCELRWCFSSREIKIHQQCMIIHQIIQLHVFAILYIIIHYFYIIQISPIKFIIHGQHFLTVTFLLSFFPVGPVIVFHILNMESCSPWIKISNSKCCIQTVGIEFDRFDLLDTQKSYLRYNVERVAKDSPRGEFPANKGETSRSFSA